jgi:hypothetical protein
VVGLKVLLRQLELVLEGLVDALGAEEGLSDDSWCEMTGELIAHGLDVVKWCVELMGMSCVIHRTIFCVGLRQRFHTLRDHHFDAEDVRD